MAPAQFIHLRLHTEFSLQDSVVRIPELVERVAALGMPAIAVTDQNNLFAMVKFYREGLKHGVKPIVGVDVLLRGRAERAQPARLTLLCKDPGGYQNVTNLITRAYLEGQERGVPLIDRGWLDAETTRGLIVLSGGPEGDVGRAIANGREPAAHRSRPGAQVHRGAVPALGARDGGIVRRHSGGAGQFSRDRAPLFAAAQTRRVAPA